MCHDEGIGGGGRAEIGTYWRHMLHNWHPARKPQCAVSEILRITKQQQQQNMANQWKLGE